MISTDRKAFSPQKDDNMAIKYDLNDKMTVEELNVELDNNSICLINEVSQLLRLFNHRRQLIDLKRKILAEDYTRKQDNIRRARNTDLAAEIRTSTDKQMVSLLTNLDSYSKYKTLISNIWTHNVAAITKSETTKTTQFWNTNKKLESQIDLSLKKLKNCDQAIDRIVNEEFETCTNIDEIEEHIRQILRKKQEDHIRKAEPYSRDKSKLLEVLQTKQIQREQVKDQKRQIIRNIMTLLEELKNHRQERAQAVLGLLYGADLNLHTYQQFVDSLEAIARSRQGLAELQQQQTKVEEQLNTAYKRSVEVAQLFTERQSDEARLFTELNSSYRSRIKLLLMERLFTIDTLPEGAARNLGQLLKKCREYKKILETAFYEQQSVKGGLVRTKETIEVFDRVLKSIDSEKQRRHRLLHQLEKIQEHHSQLLREQQRKRDMLVQIENLKNRRRQLDVYLNQLVTEADLLGYKKTTEDITELDKEIQAKQDRYDLLDKQLTANERELIGFTNSIKNDFNDILKQVVPNSWMKNHDLKKFENIFQLNVYLNKTFKRLNL